MEYFRNAQWVVNDIGIVAVGHPSYEIDADRLLEKAGAGGDFYDWPRQVGTKTWVDGEAFIEAYRIALNVHADRYEGEVDEDLLERSIANARRYSSFSTTR